MPTSCEARDAAGARLANGLRVDPWGHAIVPTLTPFSTNQIEIDPKGLPISVELETTQQNVAPTAGAIVKMKFETDNPGRAAILRANGPDGKPLPFGAEVSDAQGQSIGTVAQGGRIVARGLKDDVGVLNVRWGSGQAGRMQAGLHAAEARQGHNGIVRDRGCGVPLSGSGGSADGAARGRFKASRQRRVHEVNMMSIRNLSQSRRGGVLYKVLSVLLLMLGMQGAWATCTKNGVSVARSMPQQRVSAEGPVDRPDGGPCIATGQWNGR